MKYKNVSDSSSNIFSIPGESYTTVPMKVVAQQEYVDVETLDLAGMMEDLKDYKGKSGSSCPNVGEWLDAFGDSDVIFCITISRNLSGSYNAACQASNAYVDEHPDSLVYVLDSKATGPTMGLLIDKILELIHQGLDSDVIFEKVLEYQNHVHTLFCLESLNNLARNGRTSPAIAKIAGVLGIRVCDDAVGCDKVEIRPHAVAGITAAAGHLDTPQGRISVSWRLENGKMVVEKTVPKGVTVR